MRVPGRIVSAPVLLLPPCATWSVATPESAAKFQSAASNQFLRDSPARNGRYPIHTALLLDSLRPAPGFNAGSDPGVPPSVDLRRFEFGAKVAKSTPPETLVRAGGGDEAQPEGSGSRGPHRTFDACALHLCERDRGGTHGRDGPIWRPGRGIGRRRPVPVYLIDHMEAKPAEN
jgi:hypothetical protein